MWALVTGASSGIGRDIAKTLSKKGYDIILVAREEGKLREVQNEIKTKSEVISLDLASSQNCIELYNKVKEKNIELLINNAGFGVFGEITETDLDKELNLIDTNIKAVHILTKLFLKDMVEKNSGTILNVSSIASFAPGPLMSAYYASKSYVTRFTLGIKEELKRKKSKVHICLLCPGPVNTNFNNVAGVNFSLKPLSSKYVAEYTVEKISKGKTMIIPGTLNKIIRILSKLSPEGLSAKIVYRKSNKEN